MADQVTWEDDIKKFFDQLDVGCMRAKQPNPLDLADYDSVKKRFDAILNRLKLRIKDPNSTLGMPKGGRPWPQEKIDKFQAWKDAGFPKSKTDPVPPTS